MLEVEDNLTEINEDSDNRILNLLESLHAINEDCAATITGSDYYLCLNLKQRGLINQYDGMFYLKSA